MIRQTKSYITVIATSYVSAPTKVVAEALLAVESGDKGEDDKSSIVRLKKVLAGPGASQRMKAHPEEQASRHRPSVQALRELK